MELIFWGMKNKHKYNRVEKEEDGHDLFENYVFQKWKSSRMSTTELL